MSRLLFYVGGIVVALLVGLLHVDIYEEYFGNGPPYFARTTNMDKWSNPLPALVIGDIVVLVACWAGWRWWSTRRRPWRSTRIAGEEAPRRKP